MAQAKKIKAVRSQHTIVLHYDGKVLNIQKKQKPKYFDKALTLIEEGNEKGLKKLFRSLYELLEEMTDGNFIYKNGKLWLKDDTEKESAPELLTRKIIQHHERGEEYMPLVHFWRKLRRNPSEESRKDLYEFMEKNNIAITDEGDIIVEKGVAEKDGMLVDDRTRTIDNSIGRVVKLPREKVDDNRNRTCSFGLHVGAPDYVRNIYRNSIIVVCTVNPEHVVSVPTDYNATKMRVCQYRVMSYSDKCKIDPSERLVYKKEEILDREEIKSTRTKKKKARKAVKKAKAVKRISKVVDTSYTEKALSQLKAREIIEKVKAGFNVKIKIDVKNKKAIIKKAIEIYNERK